MIRMLWLSIESLAWSADPYTCPVYRYPPVICPPSRPGQSSREVVFVNPHTLLEAGHVPGRSPQSMVVLIEGLSVLIGAPPTAPLGGPRQAALPHNENSSGLFSRVLFLLEADSTNLRARGLKYSPTSVAYLGCFPPFLRNYVWDMHISATDEAVSLNIERTYFRYFLKYVLQKCLWDFINANII